MESDLSSSDAALRMLFVEDVELLERGIFGRKRLLSSVACQSVTEVTVQFRRSLALPGFAVPTELFFFQTGFLFLWGHLFAVSDVKHANPAVINQCIESDTCHVGADSIYDLLKNPHTYTQKWFKLIDLYF